MPIPNDLLDAIDQTLGSAILPSLSSTSAWDDLFEAYLFSIIIEAAIAEGAQVVFKNRHGANPHTFIFRTSPGYIGSTRRDYGFAELAFPNAPALEVHLGIRVVGHSKVLHEYDVSVLLKSEAGLCRASIENIAPRSSKVIIAIEAKCYSTTNAGLNLGREFLGLDIDTSAKQVIFVMNRSSISVERLLSYKNRKWEHNILPGNANDVSRLRGQFQTAFKDFRALH
jgi:hypothetical protein